MVVHRPELLARRHLCVERDLSKELVRGQAGVVGAEGARIIYEKYPSYREEKIMICSVNVFCYTTTCSIPPMSR